MGLHAVGRGRRRCARGAHGGAAGGPAPAPPLQVIGPTLSNALMGLLDQEDGRQLIRMRMGDAEDEAEPWRRPLMILTALRWDPVRKATLRDDELVAEVMRAFRRAIDVAGAPGLHG